MTQGIYAITNKENGKAYIGSSKNIESRFNNHKSLLNAGKHLAPKLQKEWDEYGADSFELVILREIEESINLVEVEQEFIEAYQAWQHYNTRKAIKPPKEVIEKDLKRPAEIDRAAYLKRTADKPRYYCTQCNRRLRVDTTHPNICRLCWLKTDEGKEYLRLKQAESRAKKC